MQAQVSIQRRTRLTRTWVVQTPQQAFEVTYDGRGIGFESVLVDGTIVVKEVSQLWFIPRFDFQVGGIPATVHVRIGPTLAIRSIALFLGDTCLYEEGRGLVPGPALSSRVKYDRHGLIDEGPCLLYDQLSYRRRYQRSLKALPFAFLWLTSARFGMLPWALAWALVALSIVSFLLQARKNYLLYKKTSAESSE